jgi:hypothetical protein
VKPSLRHPLLAALAALLAWGLAAPAQAATPRSTAQWASLYDTAFAREDATQYAKATSLDSANHYDLAYQMHGFVAMIEATGRQQYADQFWRYTSALMASAKPSTQLGSRAFHDAYSGWVSQRSDVRGQEVPLFESYLWRYITHGLRSVKADPVLWADPANQARYATLLAFAERNIWDKWYSRGANSYLYRSRTHMAAHWAYIATDLNALTADPARQAQTAAIRDNIERLGMPNYAGASLRGQLRANPVNSTGYFWSDVWGSYTRPGQDVAHGNAVLAYVVHAYDVGDPTWTRADIDRFLATWTGVVWPASGGYRDYVDGSGTGTGWFNDGWAYLARFDAAAQARLETHSVGVNAAFYATGALNARRLGY